MNVAQYFDGFYHNMKVGDIVKIDHSGEIVEVVGIKFKLSVRVRSYRGGKTFVEPIVNLVPLSPLEQLAAAAE